MFVIAREDDYFFGVLHSRVHEVWALRQGTALEDRPRYTPTTTFETFPFPWPPGQEPVEDPRVEAIAAAARDLVAKRDAWLNPPGATAAQLKDRTLTNLYNRRPAWLDQVHRRLDAAVLDAYGWPHDLSDTQLLERLLALNLVRAGACCQGSRGSAGVTHQPLPPSPSPRGRRAASTVRAGAVCAGRLAKTPGRSAGCTR